MIPTINKTSILNQIIHPIDSLQNKPSDKKPKQKKQSVEWNDKMKIISFTMPQINQSQTMVRKYKLKLIYQDETGKRHPKTIFFGDDSDYVFNKDSNKRVRRLLSMKHLNNPLHPNYWKALLLNKYQTMQQGLRQFMQYFLNKQNAQLKLKQPKVGKMPTLKPNTLNNLVN